MSFERAEARLGVAAERVNVARIKADNLRNGVADAEAKMQAADRRAGEVKSELRTQAVETYMRGGQAPAVAAGGDPARAGAYVKGARQCRHRRHRRDAGHQDQHGAAP